MSIHDLAKADFQSKRGELQSVEVVEFADGDEVPRIFYYRTLNAGELIKLTPYVNFEDLNKSDYRLILEAFAVGARDESGALLFNSVNKSQIETDWDFEIVDRLVRKMGHVQQLFRFLTAPDSEKKD